MKTLRRANAASFVVFAFPLDEAGWTRYFPSAPKPAQSGHLLKVRFSATDGLGPLSVDAEGVEELVEFCCGRFSFRDKLAVEQLVADNDCAFG